MQGSGELLIIALKLTLRLIANLRKNLQGEYGILVNTYSRMECQLNGKAFTIESVEGSTVYRKNYTSCIQNNP